MHVYILWYIVLCSNVQTHTYRECITLRMGVHTKTQQNQRGGIREWAREYGQYIFYQDLMACTLWMCVYIHIAFTIPNHTLRLPTTTTFPKSSLAREKDHSQEVHTTTLLTTTTTTTTTTRPAASHRSSCASHRLQAVVCPHIYI